MKKKLFRSAIAPWFVVRMILSNQDERQLDQVEFQCDHCDALETIHGSNNIDSIVELIRGYGDQHINCLPKSSSKKQIQ